MNFWITHYDGAKHELIGVVEGKDRRCDPYVSRAIPHDQTTELIGKTLRLPDDTMTGFGSVLLPMEVEILK